MSDYCHLISDDGRKGWVYVSSKSDLDEVMYRLNDYEVGFFDMDNTLAKHPTIDSILLDMVKHVGKRDGKLKWAAKAAKGILTQGSAAYSKLFYDYDENVLEHDTDRRRQIQAHNRTHPFKTFPGVKDFFQEFMNRYNILLTQSTPEIAEGMKIMYVKNGDIMKPFSDIICKREKYQAIENVLEDAEYLKNDILVVGDSHRDEEVKNAVEDIVGKDKCISIKVCKSRHDHDPNFDLSIGQNWNGLNRIIEEYRY
jgi:phosphoglycolate phosphatase-like HAD superfamily hydrolase